MSKLTLNIELTIDADGWREYYNRAAMMDSDNLKTEENLQNDILETLLTNQSIEIIPNALRKNMRMVFSEEELAANPVIEVTGAEISKLKFGI